MSRVRFLHLTTIAVLLLTLSPAVAQEQQQQQRAPIAGGPGTRLSVGCSATCEIQQNPKRELTCTASGASASCTTSAPRVVECKDGTSTTTCDCGTTPASCKTTTP